MKSYLVTSGVYSDYRVHGVYSTKEKADDAATLFVGDVEEYELDAVPEHPPGTRLFCVSMILETGDDARVDQIPMSFKKVLWCHVWPPAFMCECVARDESEAIKIVNEKRARFIASGRAVGRNYPASEV